MSSWDYKQQRAELIASGLSPEMAQAITNMLELNGMNVVCSPRTPQWTMRFQRHAGSCWYVLVKDVHSYSLTPWLQAAQEVEAKFGHKPAISG